MGCEATLSGGLQGSGRKRPGGLCCRGWAFERVLPVQLRLDHGDCVQHVLGPVFVFRVNHDNAKTVVLTFKPHAFGVIHMQVDIEGRWQFRRGV